MRATVLEIVAGMGRLRSSILVMIMTSTSATFSSLLLIATMAVITNRLSPPALGKRLLAWSFIYLSKLLLLTRFVHFVVEHTEGHWLPNALYG